MRRFKHLSWNDRLKIETMIKDKIPMKEIAERIGVHISTIYREVERGQYEHKNTDWTTEMRYAAEIAQAKYESQKSAKGAPVKIGNDHALAQHIEQKIIKDKYSPAAVLGEIKAKGLAFKTSICTSTLYSYIEKGIFLKLSNKNLFVKGVRKRKYRHIRAARATKGTSIEKRPQEVNERTTFGHWEMDSTIGKKNKRGVLLVLTERLTRNEIEILVPDGTSASVVTALDNLEVRYGELFKKIFLSITVDNGSEFADCEGIERSALHEGKRTQLYYCHPFSSWERGSNENQNKMIRRFFPKGTDLSKTTAAEVAAAEEWLNNYPRKIFGFCTAADMFQKCVASL
jgi:Transposase and inactivated derivatives, IS30 family